MLVSGFVTWEVFTEWPAAEELFLRIPDQCVAALGWPGGAGWIHGLWALGVVPLVVWSALAGLIRLMGEAESFPILWRRIALPLAVVVAAGHMAKGLAKASSWGGFLPYTLWNASGESTVSLITTKAIPSPGPLLPMTVVVGVSILLLISSMFIAIREARLANPTPHTHIRLLLPNIGFASAFLLIVWGWGFAL